MFKPIHWKFTIYFFLTFILFEKQTRRLPIVDLLSKLLQQLWLGQPKVRGNKIQWITGQEAGATIQELEPSPAASQGVPQQETWVQSRTGTQTKASWRRRQPPEAVSYPLRQALISPNYPLMSAFTFFLIFFIFLQPKYGMLISCLLKTIQGKKKH